MKDPDPTPDQARRLLDWATEPIHTGPAPVLPHDEPREDPDKSAPSSYKPDTAMRWIWGSFLTMCAALLVLAWCASH